MTSSMSGEAIDADHDRRQRSGMAAVGSADRMPQRAQPRGVVALVGDRGGDLSPDELGDASDQIVLVPPTAR